MKIPTLETERLTLRPYKIEDARRVKELAGNWEVSKTTLNIPYPLEQDSVEEWISTLKKLHDDAEGARFCIDLKDTGEMIGSIGLIADKRHNRAKLDDHLILYTC